MESNHGDDEEWLRTFEYFEGYFDNPEWSDGRLRASGLDIGGIGEFARIVRCLMRDAPFVRATVKSTVRFYESLPPPSLDTLGGIRALAIHAADSSRSRRLRWARLVADLVLDALYARAVFDSLPKRTPIQHRKHYLAIAAKAEGLLTAIAEEVEHGDYYGIGSGIDSWDAKAVLQDIANAANEAANSPRLSRPHADDALRTYVAQKISESFDTHTRGLRHAAAASLLNAVFPDSEETKDAEYMQSIARKLDGDP